MNDPSAAMQVAIYSRLTSHAAMLAAFGGPVRAYDKTPGPKPEYPYLRIGDDQVLPRSNACMDGWDCVVTIHIFSQHAQRPRMQVKEISDAILQAIATQDTPPTPAGYAIKSLELGQARTYFEADGLVAHGVLTVEYLVRPAA